MELYELKQELCTLCRHFYTLGWVSGTGGGIAIRHEKGILMAPSGVEKERIQPDEIFLVDEQGVVIESPQRPAKLTECAPLFLAAFKYRNAGACMHSHSLNIVMAAALVPSGEPLVFHRMEMMKGLEGVGYFDQHEIPVIHNTARECELTDRLEQAILDYPNSNAVIVRNHGVYIWGRDARHTKTQTECLDYLCEAKVRFHTAGTDHLLYDNSQPKEPVQASFKFDSDQDKLVPDMRMMTLPDSEDTTFAIQLAKDIRQSKYTIREVAQRCGTSSASVNKWKAGEVFPAAHYLYRMAQILHEDTFLVEFIRYTQLINKER